MKKYLKKIEILGQGLHLDKLWKIFIDIKFINLFLISFTSEMFNLFGYLLSWLFNLHDYIVVIQLISDSVVTNRSQVPVENYLVSARNVVIILLPELGDHAVNQFYIVQNFVVFLWVRCVNRLSGQNPIQV